MRFKKGNIPWNKQDIKIYCKYCKKEIWPRDRLSRIYCSRKCQYADFRGKSHKGSEKGQFKKGNKPWNDGLKVKRYCIDCGIELKNINAKRCKECYGKNNRGKNHYNWLNGAWKDPYNRNFKRKLKEEIRVLDAYVCRLCGKLQCEINQKLHVHHIDYDKNNLDFNNLISLCPNCHGKTNFKRKFWKRKLQWL